MCYRICMYESVWHILRVKSGTEHKVAAESGYPSFVPSYKRTYFNRRFRMKVSYIAAILPGFVFVKIPCPSEFVMRPCADVFGFMRNGDKTPAVLSDKAFNDLLALVEELQGQPEKTEQVRAAFEVGQSISVELVKHDRRQGKVVEIRDGRVFVQLSGSHLSVEVKDLDAIAA